MKKISKPGLYDVPEDRYNADDVLVQRLGRSLSHSGAKKLVNPKLTPAHFKYEREHGAPMKRAFDFGHAAHAFLLGSGAEIVRVDARDWRTNAAKAAAEEARAAGAVPLLAEEYDRALVMVEEARKHPRVRQVLERTEDVEKAAYWIDDATGVTRRARFDVLSRTKSGRLVGVDYKTTAAAGGAHRDSFGKTADDFGYLQQEPWYVDALAALELDDDPGFLFIVQEKVAPYLVSVLTLPPEMVRVGRERNARALEIYAECESSGEWPGYPVPITEATTPKWFNR